MRRADLQAGLECNRLPECERENPIAQEARMETGINPHRLRDYPLFNDVFGFMGASTTNRTN
jgi:hypothetical protein